MEVTLRLLALLLWQLIPSLLVLHQLLVVFDILKSQQPIEEQAVHVVDHEVAELTEVLWMEEW